MTTTLDFQIKPDKKTRYRVQVVERCKKKVLAKAPFAYDFSYVTRFEINQLEPDSKDPHGRLERLQAFGKKLHDQLFSSEIQEVWQQFKEAGDFLVLCIRLDPKVQELAALPWETLFDGEEYLAAGPRTSLTRLPLDVPAQSDLPPIPLPGKDAGFVFQSARSSGT